MTLPSPGTLDLLADTGPRPLACEPDCTLSATTLGRLSVPVRRLHLEGEVRDSRSLSRLPVGLPFVFELVLPAGSGPPVLAAPLALQVSRELPPRIHLDVALTPGPWLFDGVQWASLAGGGGPVTLSPTGNEAERAAYEQVLASLGEGTLAGSYERSSL